MASYDYSKFPQGPNQRRDFVLSLLGQSELRESDYIEVKSEFDLMNRQHQIKVAKFILGAANRTPEPASRYLGGYAVLVAGLGRNEVIGIQGEELIDLNKEVQKFVGAPGDAPEWFTERVEFKDGKTVLLVFVAPPTGSIYPSLATTGKELISGTVYVRNPGQTKEISGQQLRAKVRRLEANSNSALMIAVTTLGPTTELKPQYPAARAMISELVNALQEDAPEIPKKQASSNAHSLIWANAYMPALPGSRDYYGRTPQEFHELLNLASGYTDSELEDLANQLARYQAPPITIELNLRSRTHAEAVELSVRFPDAVQIIDEVTKSDIDDCAKTYVPEKWTSHISLGYEISETLRKTAMQPAQFLSTGQTVVRQVSEHECIFYIEEVRFGRARRFVFEDYRLIRQPGAEGPLTAEWTLTARNYAGQISGSIEMK